MFDVFDIKIKTKYQYAKAYASDGTKILGSPKRSIWCGMLREASFGNVSDLALAK
ncbi:MAG: hypothetical protein PHT07_12960 [Paludibacter sp.]|nr:hypothetical protein [Paludibacter sp.]